MEFNFDLEHIVDYLNVPEDELLQLLGDAFVGADTLWPANQRWLAWIDHRLVACVAIQRRWFRLASGCYEGWMVGTVGTTPDLQRRGIATQLLRITHADLRKDELAFAVLNCGASRVRFYERNGYQQVSARATYLRDGLAVIDNDPAMAISLQPEFDVTRLAGDSFPFGFDF
ncbi:MAG: GNAT family N-acetyltransferase [bacterium]|nr:GNAT family N-acetyltransferase [bacterium]